MPTVDREQSVNKEEVFGKAESISVRLFFHHILFDVYTLQYSLPPSVFAPD